MRWKRALKTHTWSSKTDHTCLLAIPKSTSSGEEDRRTNSLEAENKEFPARIEALEKKEGEGVQGVQ